MRNDQRHPRRQVLEVDGMSCGHCVGAVKAALARVPEIKVRSVEVGSAVIESPNDRAIAAAIAALGAAGYPAKPRSE
jgi:copper chaperone